MTDAEAEKRIPLDHIQVEFNTEKGEITLCNGVAEDWVTWQGDRKLALQIAWLLNCDLIIKSEDGDVACEY